MQQSSHERGRGRGEPGRQDQKQQILEHEVPWLHSCLSLQTMLPHVLGGSHREHPPLYCSFSCYNYTKKVVPAFQKLSNGKDSDKHMCRFIKGGQALRRNTAISGTEDWRKVRNCRNLKELQVVRGGQKSTV